MMRGKSQRSIEIINAAYEILEEIEPASVRAVCYQLFIKELIPDMSRASTASVSRLLTAAREEGTVPWGWIVDESRAAEYVTTWSSADARIAYSVRNYRRDYWQDQPVRVEVWSEKGTVRGTLAPILDEFGVAFRVMHGFASATVINEIAEESQASVKPLYALYVGDWDPSGKYMSDVDLPVRLERYGGEVILTRIALDADDTWKLPSFDVDTKKDDARYQWFNKHVETDCYELDALPPPDMRSRVRAAIRELIDKPLWDHATRIEKVEVASMQEFHEQWRSRLTGANSDQTEFAPKGGVR